jgi:hypothetical protein
MKSIVLFAFLFSAVLSQSVLYVPTMDAVLDNAQPTTNIGTTADTTIWTDYYGDHRLMDLLFKLDLTGVSNNFTAVNVWYKQEFQAAAEQAAGPIITFSVMETNNTWAENTVTWANAPATLRTLYTAYQDGNINYVIVPVTTIVRDALISGRTTVSVRCSTSNFDYVWVWMREASTTNRVKVVFTY